MTVIIQMQKYVDGDGNVYQVEKATNGNFVVVRINPGGNRKLARSVGEPAHTAERMQRWLDIVAEEKNWRKAVVV